MSSRTLVRLLAAGVILAGSLSQGASAASYRLPAVTFQAQLRRTFGLNQGVGGRGRPAFGQFGGGFGGPRQDVALVAQFDKDGNGRLNAAERRAAREYAESLGLNRGRGGRRGGMNSAAEPGPRVAPDSVQPNPGTPFYDPGTLRTLFLTFENDEWERELMAFKSTDVDVPATLMIDGRTYPDVGVQFHGNSSFSGVPLGLKHSMRIALDFVHEDQNVQGYNTLLLLNAHEDGSFLKSVLALQVFRDYIPAPKANFVRTVVNGESWGVFVNQQQFNKDLIRESFKTTDGARWKVPGSPGGRGGGLSYNGDDTAAYKRAYEIKSKDEPASWTALIRMTRILNQTASDLLESSLSPLLDVDAALRFLAVDNALVNGDGYWTRASDYSLYMDPGGRFHVLPYDVNSTFESGGGRGFGRGGSVTLDPLQAASDPAKALASKLLAVPALRARYLAYVRDVATKWLDWRRLGPLVQRYQALIDADVKADTRKLYSYEAFRGSADQLRSFADRRREYLLDVTR